MKNKDIKQTMIDIINFYNHKESVSKEELALRFSMHRGLSERRLYKKKSDMIFSTYVNEILKVIDLMIEKNIFFQGHYKQWDYLTLKINPDYCKKIETL